MKVTIKEWSAVASWHWDMPDDDVCGICRNPYDSTCSRCKYPGDQCPLLLGSCNHSFHMHCILSWLRQSSSLQKCPMCRQPFESTSAEKNAQLEAATREQPNTEQPVTTE